MYLEPCQSGLTYIFAKDAGASKPLAGSNPAGSAEEVNCFTSVLVSKDFSIRAKRDGKVPGYVIAGSVFAVPAGSAKKYLCYNLLYE